MGKVIVKSRVKKRFHRFIHGERAAVYGNPDSTDAQMQEMFAKTGKFVRKIQRENSNQEYGTDSSYKRLMKQIEKAKMAKVDKKLQEGKQILKNSNSSVVADKILAPNIAAQIAQYL